MHFIVHSSQMQTPSRGVSLRKMSLRTSFSSLPQNEQRIFFPAINQDTPFSSKPPAKNTVHHSNVSRANCQRAVRHSRPLTRHFPNSPSVCVSQSAKRLRLTIRQASASHNPPTCVKPTLRHGARGEVSPRAAFGMRQYAAPPLRALNRRARNAPGSLRSTNQSTSPSHSPLPLKYPIMTPTAGNTLGVSRYTRRLQWADFSIQVMAGFG